MFRPSAKAAFAAALLLAMTAGHAHAATFATFDANQFDSNGFAFGDFNDFFAIDTSGGTLNIDIMNDLDLANGLFGGMGSDLVADFDANTTQIEVALTVDALNAAPDFRVVLVDNDGPTAGEEYQFLFDLTGVTPGQPVVLTQSLVSPGPIFSQPAFGQDPGDGVQNYGLRQVQIQSAFGGTDRLKINVESVKLVDPDDPLLIELTPSTFEAQVASFDFGIFQDAGVVDQSGGTFVIDANQSPTPGESGGLGFSGLSVDFDATQHAIEVEARLLPGNLADSFNLLMGDNDGEDSGPEMGSEDYIFTVPTSEFNETDFATFTIPLGSGTESGIETTFGFTNGGDGLQNFGLSQLQIQTNADAEGDTGDGLAIEIAGFRIVEFEAPTIEGDFDNDGDVDIIDFGVFADNFGLTDQPIDPPVDGDFEPDGDVDIIDFGVFADNFGIGVESVAVPEPATWALLAGLLTTAACRRAV